MTETKGTIIVEGNEVKNYMIRVRDYIQALVADLDNNINDLDKKIEEANKEVSQGDSNNG
jgi:hypothetical protein